MKFSDCEFKSKHEVRHDVTQSIIIACKESIPDFEKLNIFQIEDYVHILIDESYYNVKKHYFYEKDTGVRIPLKVFKSVAIEYILEHINEFRLFKYKK